MAEEGVQEYIVDPNVYICDPVPQETPDQNRIYPFYDHLKEGRLTTTQCSPCGHIAWPPRIVCPECMSDDLKWVDFPPTGKIYAFTIQTGGVPPGFQAPLVYALIDFDNDVRIISPLIETNPDDVAVGDEVVLKVVDAPRDRVLFFFKLKK
jgi:uncharacterized OB-fold protein